MARKRSKPTAATSTPPSKAAPEPTTIAATTTTQKPITPAATCPACGNDQHQHLSQMGDLAVDGVDTTGRVFDRITRTRVKCCRCGQVFVKADRHYLLQASAAV